MQQNKQKAHSGGRQSIRTYNAQIQPVCSEIMNGKGNKQGTVGACTAQQVTG